MNKFGVCITKRKHKKRSTYELRWCDPKSGRTRTKAVGRDKTYARLQAVNLQQELESGAYIELTPITYKDFKTEHLEAIEGTLGDRTVDEHDLVLRQFDEACKPKKMTGIDFNMLERFRKSRLADGVSPATINKGMVSMQSILERAILRGYLKVNPFVGKRRALLMKVPEKEPSVISQNDFKKLLTACHNDQWRAIVTVAYYAGLRRGEILSLEWYDVDFESNMIHVRNKDHHLTKSRKIRMVPMTHQVATAIRRLRVKMLKSDLVFTNERGVKIKNNHDRAYRSIAKRAGLLDDKGNPRYGLHDLRRSCATELQRQGVSMKTTQRILGHANISTTAKSYTGVEEKDLREAMKRLENQTS